MLLVTFTVIMSVFPGPTLPSEYEIMEPPSGAVNVPVLFEMLVLAGAAITTPVGRLSVKATSLAGFDELLLSMVKVKVLTEPGPISSLSNSILKAG